MYTKIFSLTLFFVLVTTATISVELNLKGDVTNIETAHHLHSSITSHIIDGVGTLSTSVNLPVVIKHSTHVPHGEEDGKAHYLHFTRYKKRKWRNAFFFIAKFILLIAHLGTLIITAYHLLH